MSNLEDFNKSLLANKMCAEPIFEIETGALEFKHFAIVYKVRDKTSETLCHDSLKMS